MDDLREKIKESEVKVEMESHSSNLADELNKIRHQYDDLAKKNLKDTEDWYQNKVPSAGLACVCSFSSSVCSTTSSLAPQFDSIKVSEAQNNEALLSGKKELKELLKQKQTLEIRIQSVQAMVDTHTHRQTFLASLLSCHYPGNTQPDMRETFNLRI